MRMRGVTRNLSCVPHEEGFAASALLLLLCCSPGGVSVWSAGWWGQLLGVAACRFTRPISPSGFKGQQWGERPGELMASKGGWVLLALVKEAAVCAASPWQSCFFGEAEDFYERMESSALQTDMPPSLQRGTRQLLPGPAQHPAGQGALYLPFEN